VNHELHGVKHGIVTEARTQKDKRRTGALTDRGPEPDLPGRDLAAVEVVQI
jgi:hypothetical protein